MPLYYFSKVPAASECIGNSLSTFNIDLSSLDNSLYSLSTFTVNSVNFLSSTVITVSSNLQTQINFVSSNAVADYTLQKIVYQQPNGVIDWNVSQTGHNAKVTLTANGRLNNIVGCIAGDTGNLVIQLSSLSSQSLTAWGDKFLFANNISAMNSSASAYNLLSFYYDGDKFLTNISTF